MQCDQGQGGQGYDGTYEWHQCQHDAVRSVLIYDTDAHHSPDRMELCAIHYQALMHEASAYLAAFGQCTICGTKQDQGLVEHRFGCSLAAWIIISAGPIFNHTTEPGDKLNEALDRTLELLVAGMMLVIMVASIVISLK